MELEQSSSITLAEESFDLELRSTTGSLSTHRALDMFYAGGKLQQLCALLLDGLHRTLKPSDSTVVFPKLFYRLYLLFFCSELFHYQPLLSVPIRSTLFIPSSLSVCRVDRPVLW